MSIFDLFRKKEKNSDNNIANDQEYIISEIVKFTTENIDPGVFYSVIYGKFLKEFENLNINSVKEVKNLIDEKILIECNRTEKYISVYDSEEKIKERIIEIAKNSNQEFRIFELAKMVPGIQWPMLENVIKEGIVNGILVKSRDAKEKYPFYKYKEVSKRKEKNSFEGEEAIYVELYNFIIELLREVNCEMISLSIVYAQLQVFKKELFEELGIEKNIDKLGYIIHKRFKYRLFVNKYYVSKRPVRKPTDVICDYLKTLDKFEKNDINIFQRKTGMYKQQSYEKIIDKLNDDFVRVGATEMVKKEKFNISEEKLKEIDRSLKFYLKNNNVLDTSKIKKYVMFPSLGEYQWNKYLLTGIIKTYFNDCYEIENYKEKAKEREINYIIRRKENEC